MVEKSSGSGRFSRRNRKVVLGHLGQQAAASSLSSLARNLAESVKGYRKAADQGCNLALQALSLCYEYGKGVPQDKAEARKWQMKIAIDQNEAGD